MPRRMSVGRADVMTSSLRDIAVTGAGVNGQPAGPLIVTVPRPIFQNRKDKYFRRALLQL